MPTTLRVNCWETTSKRVVDGDRDLRRQRHRRERFALGGLGADVGELHARGREQRFEKRLVAGELRRDDAIRPLHRGQVCRRQHAHGRGQSRRRGRSRRRGCRISVCACWTASVAFWSASCAWASACSAAVGAGAGAKPTAALAPELAIATAAMPPRPPRPPAVEARCPGDQLALDVAILEIGRLAVADELDAVERERLLAAGVGGEA